MDSIQIEQIEAGQITSGQPGAAAGPAGHEDAGGDGGDDRAAVAAAYGGGPDAILENIRQMLPQEANPDEALARKCNCRTNWCRTCYMRYHLPRHLARLREIPWDEARFVTLTMDPHKCGEGADAYLFYREHGQIGYFIDRLRRLGIKIIDWCGFIEFHLNGNPHFHLLIRTKKGSAGMIGNKTLLKAWAYGYVKEEHFATYKHYENLVGYLGKAGYLHKNKEYQSVLPDYFQSEFFAGKRVLRFLSARKNERVKRPKPEPEKTEKKARAKTLTWNRIKKCGRETIMFYFQKDGSGFDDTIIKYLGKVPIPYDYFKVMIKGRYSQGRGLRIDLTGTDDEPCPF
jgi:hypothetical protein